MIPQRLSVKFFIKGSAPALPPFVPLFHRWIQNNTVEGLLIDVADYEHVPDGPGILLIGHDVDYSIDLTDGKPSLMVRRKRYEDSDDFAAILRDTLRKAAQAANALHADDAVSIEIDATTVEITLIDRLQSPNTAEAYAAATSEVEAVLNALYPAGFELRQGSDDPRDCLSLVATSKSTADFASLAGNLTATV